MRHPILKNTPRGKCGLLPVSELKTSTHNSPIDTLCGSHLRGGRERLFVRKSGLLFVCSRENPSILALYVCIDNYYAVSVLERPQTATYMYKISVAGPWLL